MRTTHRQRPMRAERSEELEEEEGGMRARALWGAAAAASANGAGRGRRLPRQRDAARGAAVPPPEPSTDAYLSSSFQGLMMSVVS
jgi:hypothetical protein